MPTAEPTHTPTPVWFPATATPSAIPTILPSPTTDWRPGIGELLLEDDFSDPSAWTTGGTSDALTVVSEGTIHLSLNQSRSYLLPTRNAPVLEDFYAEITASPALCHGEDEYGLIVRANDGDHYRFAISCDGRAKVDRYLNGSLSRQAGWVSDRIIPSVIPASSRLGVWASGGQLRFFINDFYLFSVNDTQIFLGTLGVYAHTSGDSDVSVSFSGLKVWDLQ